MIDEEKTFLINIKPCHIHIYRNLYIEQEKLFFGSPEKEGIQLHPIKYGAECKKFIGLLPYSDICFLFLLYVFHLVSHS